jgi:hypothetical protein
MGYKPTSNIRITRIVFYTLTLIALASQASFAESRKIGKITFSVNPSVGSSRAEAFKAHDVGERLTKAVAEQFAARNLIDPQSKLVLNLNVYAFRLRNAITVGLFGFLHTGKDRLYYWVDLKNGDRTERLFRSRVTTLVGWLFFPSTNGRIDRMIKRISRDTAINYEKYH